MEKTVSIDVEIDNQFVATAPISRSGKPVEIDIERNYDMMELKICTGTGSRKNHIGKLNST
jgi:hypothetical protein